MTPLVTLPACRWRGPDDAGRFECGSPSVHAPYGVDARTCAGCSLADHAPPRAAKPRVAKGTPPCVPCAKAAAAPKVPQEVAARLTDADLPGRGERRFNASLLAHGGGYLLAYRDEWAGSDVWLARLDAGLRPIGQAIRLDLSHPLEAPLGREDPRLFVHAGRVHVSYVGVVRGWGTPTARTSQLYARLTADLSGVERVWYAHCPERRAMEKNWGFFSPDGGDLYAVYSISPHRILRIDGPFCPDVHVEPNPLAARWPWGEMRGGAPPVRVGDEYWSFFHSSFGPAKTYALGLYTFDAAPPYAPRRVVPTPLLVADPKTKPAGQYAAVVFPCGAARDGGDWLVSCGVHDRWSEVLRFRHDDLEARLAGA